MRRKTFEKEVDVLKMELMRSEETKKQLDFDLQTLSRRKGEKVNSILGILKKTEMAYKAEKSEIWHAMQRVCLCVHPVCIVLAFVTTYLFVHTVCTCLYYSVAVEPSS